MVEKIFSWFGRNSIKRPIVVIGIIAAITVFFAVGLFRIHQEYGERIMLPESSEIVRTMNEAEDLFGGIEEEQVLIEADNVLDASLLRKVAGYEEFLRGDPGIWGSFITEASTPLDEMYYVVETAASPASGIPVGGAPRPDDAGGDTTQVLQAGEPLLSMIGTLSDEELVRQVELNLQLKQEHLAALGVDVAPQNISADGHAILLTTKMKPGLTTSEQIALVGEFTDNTRGYFVEVPGVTVHIAGSASMHRESSQSTIADTKSLFVLAFIFMLLILFLTFRRVTDVIFTLLVMMVTIVWVMGLSGWLGFPFSYGNTAIMPLLLGIDIAYAIHVLSRYYEERGKGEGPNRSALVSVVTVGVAVFLTAATTAFGFASFGISNMPLIQQFGVLCVVGVMASFVLSVTILPAVIVLRDRRSRAEEKWIVKQRKRSERPRQSPIDAFLAKIAVLSEHHRGVVAAVSLFIILCCAGLGFKLGTEADVFKMLPQGLPFIQATQKINDYFGGQEIVLTLVKGDILEPASLNAMLAYEEALSANDYVNESGERLFQRRKIFSIADVVQNTYGSIPASRGEVLGALARLQRSSGSNQSMADNQLITEDLGTALVSIRLDRGTQQDMKVMAETIDRETAAVTTATPDIAVSSSGFPLLVHEMLGTIVPTQIKTTALALVLCALIVMLVFRSFFFGLAAASVVFISVAMELGVLAILNWPLDFMTVMVSSLVIGAGIDFGIHVTHRFMEEWRDGGVEIDEAIRRTVGNVGKALLSAAVTTAGAFLILSFSKIDYMQRFGVITALSLTFALLSSLLILPSILAWRAQAIERKKART